MPDFESQARTLRYQVLGKACRREGIRILCLGHHQDDDIETGLVRIAQGQQKLGLQGVPEIARIPECHGLYGIAESGEFMEVREKVPNRNAVANISNTEMPLPIADGGVFLFRPFMKFPKSRLLATCIENNVPFVSDPTNADYTLTPRNAVRYLLTSDKLPRALQGLRISSLMKSCRKSAAWLAEASNKVFCQSEVRMFDNRTGCLLINLPQRPHNEIPNNEQVYTVALRRILDVVSPAPRNATALWKVQNATAKVFGTAAIQKKIPFTLGEVHFQPVRQAGGKYADSLAHIDNSAPRNNPDGEHNLWLLTRSPFRDSMPKPSIPIKILHTFPAAATPCLWDDRFWIRVWAQKTPAATLAESVRTFNDVSIQVSLVIRSLEVTDLHRIAHSRSIHEKPPGLGGSSDDFVASKQFSKLLRLHAPGKTRFTIPVIAEAGGSERVICFPTLNIRLPIIQTPTLPLGWELKWEAQYKFVEPDFFKMVEWHPEATTTAKLPPGLNLN